MPHIRSRHRAILRAVRMQCWTLLGAPPGPPLAPERQPDCSRASGDLGRKSLESRGQVTPLLPVPRHHRRQTQQIIQTSLLKRPRVSRVLLACTSHCPHAIDEHDTGGALLPLGRDMNGAIPRALRGRPGLGPGYAQATAQGCQAPRPYLGLPP